MNVFIEGVFICFRLGIVKGMRVFMGIIYGEIVVLKFFSRNGLRGIYFYF